MTKETKKKGTKKNKLGVKNSLVNNINARKKKGISKSRKKSTVSKRSYKQMEDKWGEKN
ncbi:hypothetical protein BH10BAC2_BH10BAC2_20870 [soil metagenome]